MNKYDTVRGMIFSSSFHAGNRQALVSRRPDALIILTAHAELQKSLDSAYPFEQENNFWYLSGIDEPGWLLMIDGKKNQSILVMPKRKADRGLWNGAIDHFQAKEISGVDNVLTYEDFLVRLKSLSKRYTQVHTVLPQTDLAQYTDILFNPAPQLLAMRLKKQFAEVHDIRLEISKLRAIKQPIELQAIQRAIDISISGIKEALKGLVSMNHEYEFQAELNKQFSLNAGNGHAYDPIVASAANACTLHYSANSAELKDESLLLFDVGARYQRYCADITRTVPIGTMSVRHQAVYRAVKAVHDDALVLCRPGQSVVDYQAAVEQSMGEQLLSLGLIEEISTDAIREFFPHAVSHGLGIDVHDPLGRAETFAENMVITVEPGIYIPQEGIGIRLENDIHITAEGPVNMSSALPDDPTELASLVKR